MDIKRFLSSETNLDLSGHEWYEGSEEPTDLSKMELKQYLSERNVDLRYQECYGKSTFIPVKCKACYERISGPAYVYKNRSYSEEKWALHKTCGESPCQIQHPLHPEHPLEVDCTNLESPDAMFNLRFRCQGCGRYGFGLAYACRACDFKLDFKCVSNLAIQKLTLEGKMEMKADFHDHKLLRFSYDMFLSTDPELFKYIRCSCCTKDFNGSAFACLNCNLFIHESCIHTVPHGEKIASPFHLEHPLLLQLSEEAGSCQACRAYLRYDDLILSCQDCFFNDSFHISCAGLPTSGLRLKQYHEDHLMFYIYSASGFLSETRKCAVCYTTCEKSHVYGCLSCDVFVHLECIPLPRIVKHQSHTYNDHAFTLSYSKNQLDFSSSEYHCFVCEEKGTLNHPFYHCEHCLHIAHIDCILSGEDSPLEVIEYLVPRPVEKVESKLNDKELWLQEEYEKPEEENEDDEAEAELEDYSIVEIDERIATIKEQMDRLALQLKPHQKVRIKKLNHLAHRGLLSE